MIAASADALQKNLPLVIEFPPLGDLCDRAILSESHIERVCFGLATEISAFACQDRGKRRLRNTLYRKGLRAPRVLRHISGGAEYSNSKAGSSATARRSRRKRSW